LISLDSYSSAARNFPVVPVFLKDCQYRTLHVALLPKVSRFFKS